RSNSAAAPVVLRAPAVPVAPWPQMADPNAVLPPASQLAVLTPLGMPAARWPPLSPLPPAAALGVAIPLDPPAASATPLPLALPAALLRCAPEPATGDGWEESEEEPPRALPLRSNSAAAPAVVRARAVPAAQWPQMADPNTALPPASQLAVLTPLEMPAAPWPALSPLPPAAALGVAIPLDPPAAAATPLPAALPAAPLPCAPAPATATAETGGQHQHALGCMFYPQLDKPEVLAVVSEILCAPGFVSGPSEGKRLMRSVGSGRVDIPTMSRLLRWFRGERAARELRDRGLEFVGPYTDDVVKRITTGLGMTRLTQEVIACGYPAGTQFVVCSASSSDACSGVISGVLTAAASDATSNATSDAISDATSAATSDATSNATSDATLGVTSEPQTESDSKLKSVSE
ncbi:unnamed protein product, partial [Laminaria digitata]